MQTFERLFATIALLAVTTALVSAQHSVVQSLSISSGTYRATLVAPVLSSDVTLTLPSSGSGLVSGSEAWVNGGQSLLAGPNRTLGSTNAQSIQVVTNGTSRLHINQGSGYVSLGSTADSSGLSIAGALSTEPPAEFDIETIPLGDPVRIPIGNRSFVVITNGAGGNYGDNTIISIEDGSQDGQVVTIVSQASAAQTMRLLNTELNVDLTDNRNLETGNTLMLVWYNGRWCEVMRRNN